MSLVLQVIERVITGSWLRCIFRLYEKLKKYKLIKKENFAYVCYLRSMVLEKFWGRKSVHREFHHILSFWISWNLGSISESIKNLSNLHRHRIDRLESIKIRIITANWLQNFKSSTTYHRGGVLKETLSMKTAVFIDNVSFKTPPRWYELIWFLIDFDFLITVNRISFEISSLFQSNPISTTKIKENRDYWRNIFHWGFSLARCYFVSSSPTSRLLIQTFLRVNWYMC